MRRLTMGILAAALVAPAYAAAQSHADHEEAAVRQAVLDYVDAIYEVKPELIERSVSPDLVKRGYWKQSPDAEYRELPMNYEQLHQLAATWNSDGHLDASQAVKEIIVYDVLDKTATAKLTADWGVDYMQLAMEDGRWMIKNILWQSTPPGDM